MRINIPLSVFAYKVLLSIYKKEPFVIKSSDEIASVLCYRKAGDDNKLDKVIASLTNSTAFEVSNTIAKSMQSMNWRIGLAIDDYFRNDLNKFVFTKTTEGQGATAAIQMWCTENGVDIDIDINFDTLYRDWQRYSKEKTTFFRQKKSEFVRKSGEKKQTRIAFTDKELEAIIEQYMTDNPTYFLTNKGKPRKKLAFQLKIYIYRIVGKRSVDYVAKKFKLRILRQKCNGNIKIEYDARIRYSVRTFRIFLKSAPAIVLP
jgi:hypothetical protein